MLRQLLLILSFAFLFGLGQQGAATHAISHLADWQEQQPDQAPHNPHCEECVAYAGLASALTSQAFVLAVVAPSFEPYAALTPSTPGTTPLHYSARAPPVLA